MLTYGTPTVEMVWWLFFWTAVGLSLGSFLNAVIYRLPLQRSLSDPRYSACPYCRKRIRWYDNLPIVSFILLRGRCRDCHAPIGTRYVVVEAAMALIVLMLLDAFLIGQVRSGLSESEVGLTDRLAYDWPVLLAHVILFACLLSMSAIDLEHYWVDVRFTNFATAAGFVLHGVWNARGGAAWMVPFDTTAVVAICGMVGLLVTWLVLVCQPHIDPEDFGETAPEADKITDTVDLPKHPRTPLVPPPRIAGWVLVGLLAALVVGLFMTETGHTSLKHAPRALLPLAVFFILIVSESTITRAADQQIAEAIEEERHSARGMVLSELALLLPAVGCGLVGLWVMGASADFPDRVHEAMRASVFLPSADLFQGWSPLAGFATAATGYIIAGAIGWTVRIVFTLLFGKEAFGTGDIHLMAATGCVAGWPVVLVGFFLTCGLALAGWVMTLPFKRTRALPLGPWLSLSFLTVVVFYDRILTLPIISRTLDAARMLFLENSQL